MGTERTEIGMERVIARFPEHASSIQSRFHGDQNFRDMCGDYAETLDVLQRWQVSGDPQRGARIAEYEELARALESEMVTALRLLP